MKPITVNFSEKSLRYEINFSHDFDVLIPKIESQICGRNFLVVTDKNVFRKTGFFKKSEFIKKNQVLVLPAGESEKNWKTVEKILEAGFGVNLDRNSVFLAVGGGVIGDLTGFAASVFMRGIPVIQVPTTLLSLVDSSLGGKTGFDTSFGKNLVGSFHQPEMVFCTREFLDTLPEIEVKNGLCEMIKHGIIASESHFRDIENLAEDFFDFSDPQKQKNGLDKIFSIVPDSIAIKKKIVEKDQKELGIRGFLNLGHTFGHAIELLSEYKIPHGTAVAMGCVLAAQLATEKGICTEYTADRIENIFQKFEIDTFCAFSEKNIWKSMQYDKKKKQGKIRLILPEKIGKVRYWDNEQ